MHAPFVAAGQAALDVVMPEEDAEEFAARPIIDPEIPGGRQRQHERNPPEERAQYRVRSREYGVPGAGPFPFEEP